MVANLRSLEVRSDAGADRADERLDLLVLEHAVDASTLDVENLAANRKDRLGSGVTSLLRGSPGAVTLHDEELTLVGVLGRAVGELSRHRVAVEQRLAPREVACLARGDTGPRRLHRLLQDRASLRRMLIEPIREFLVCGLLDQRTHLGVAELRLGLPLELRVAQLHRDDRGEAFTNVLTEQVLVLVLEDALRPGVLVDNVGQGLLEPLLVHAAFGRRDVVGEGVQAFVVAGVPLHCDLDFEVVRLVLERDHALEQRLLRLVEVLHEVLQPTAELVGVFDRRCLALVAQDDLKSAVEEGHLAQPLEQRLGAELGLLEDVGVGPERHRCPRLP